MYTKKGDRQSGNHMRWRVVFNTPWDCHWFMTLSTDTQMFWMYRAVRSASSSTPRVPVFVRSYLIPVSYLLFRSYHSTKCVQSGLFYRSTMFYIKWKSFPLLFILRAFTPVYWALCASKHKKSISASFRNTVCSTLVVILCLNLYTSLESTSQIPATCLCNSS